jgi:hypothetical protein
VKVDPVAAAAVRATLVPETTVVLQALPQLMPLGLDVTVPVPVPALATARVNVIGVVAGAAQPSGV